MDKHPTYCELEKQLAVALQKAEGAEKLKKAFLANISHEIRTPMNAIIGASEILCDNSLTKEDRNEFTSILNTSSRSLLNLLNQILDLSQLESSIMPLNESEIDLEAIIIRLYATYEDKIRIQKKDITIDYQIDCLNPNIIIDGEKLEKAICYLLDNAINFTESGRISLYCSILDNREIKISVKDTGTGICSEQKELIFNRFNQIDNSYTRKQSGAGIGLSLCSKYMELMNGNIKFESKLGKGSIFHLILPFKYKFEKFKVIRSSKKIQSKRTAIG